MRKKVWLARQQHGEYSIFMGIRPRYSCYFWYSGKNRDDYNIIRNLCSNMVKNWFGLKKQIRPGTCIEGYFNVSFIPIKKKK